MKTTHTHTNYLAHNIENFRQDFKQILITYSPIVQHVWKLKEVVFNTRLTQDKPYYPSKTQIINADSMNETCIKWYILYHQRVKQTLNKM
jgi:hypothetical protein